REVDREDGDAIEGEQIRNHADEPAIVFDVLENGHAEDQIVGLLDGLRRAVELLEVELVDIRVDLIQAKALGAEGRDGRVFIRSDRQNPRLAEAINQALGGVEREGLLYVSALDLSL